MPLLDRAATVAEIVLDHPASARVFRQYRIDFCCRGGMTVAQACEGRGLDTVALFAEIEQAISDRARADVDPRTLATPELVKHIVSRHHDYLRKTLPFVEMLAHKVARVHGPHDPNLEPLAESVAELRAMLEPHLDDEEQSLFPALVADVADAGALSKDLHAAQDDHLRVGESLMRIRALSRDHAIPDWACTSYRTLMRELEAIEVDTFAHIHAENHVLMPRFGSRPIAASPQAVVSQSSR